MKKTIIRIICIVLCVMTMLPVIASCNDNSAQLGELEQNNNQVKGTTETTEITTETESETTDETTEASSLVTESDNESDTETEAETNGDLKLPDVDAPDGMANMHVTYNGKFIYSIIRDNDASTELKNKITSLKNLLSDSTDKSVTYRACNALIDRNPDNQDYEILIGNTIRTASIEATKGLMPKDYSVSVVGNKIVITGGSDEAICDALDYFVKQIKDELESVEDKDNLAIFIPAEYVYTHKYAAKDMKIAGVKISNFSIKYAGGSTLDTDYVGMSAGKIATAIGEYSGVFVDCKLSNTVGPSTYEILLGTTARGYALTYYAEKPEPFDYSAKVEDGKLYVCGGCEWVVDYVVDYLIERYFKAGIPIPDTFKYEGTLKAQRIFELEKNANLRIMTNNVWNNDNNNTTWSALGENCSAEVRSKGFVTCYMAFEPDVINFQEMTTKMLGLILDEFTANGYSYAATETTKHVNIIYNTKTLKLLDHGKVVYDYGCDGKSKGYAWAHFEHKATGKKFVSVSTHQWWKSESDQIGSDAWREKQSTEVSKKCVELAKTYNCPVFLGGDFNTSPQTKAYNNILAEGMKSCFDTALAKDDARGHHSCGPEGFARGSKGTNAQAIDHMFQYNLGASTLNSFRRAEPYFFVKLSDHSPIYVDVVLR